MKKSIYVSALAAGCSLLFAAGGIAAEEKSKSEQREQEKQGYSLQQARQEQKSPYAQQLMTADDLGGAKIQNQQGEEIGSVDKVVLDSKDGQIAYVVVTSGGFWGVGGEKAVIPWKAVQLQQEAGEDEPILTVNVSKEQLMNAPQGDVEEIMDRQQAEQIHQYYGVAPYWEGQQQGQQGQQQRELQMQQQEQRKELQQQQKEERKEQR